MLPGGSGDSRDFAVWINLSHLAHIRDLESLTAEFPGQVEEGFGGSVLSCISDCGVADGLRYLPEFTGSWRRGAVGYGKWPRLLSGRTLPNRIVCTNSFAC